MNVLLGVTGSIAAVKAPELVRRLRDKGHHVSCVMTESAAKFVSKLALETFCSEPVYRGMFDEEAYTMPHLRLAEKADVMLIAPATAAVIGRCAYGLAEDMVTLAYVTTTARVVMAPAMHNTMWEHPSVQENVKILKSRGVKFVGPYEGPLADNTQGEGRLADVEEILSAVEK